MTVFCLGDLMVDIVAALPGPLATGSDTPASIGLFGGGSAANTACWLAATGCAVTFVGCVGDDDLGRAAVAALAAAGVRTEVGIDPGRSTGTCIVLVTPDGERTMVPDTGANSGLSRADLPAFGPNDRLHVSGYALLNDAARPAALEAMRRARSVGAALSVDAASAAPIEAAGREAFLDWVGTELLLFANADEARALTGLPELPAARELAARCGRAVVKCGKAGAIWADGRRSVRVPAMPVRAVDSTGAGDAFAAGFLAAAESGADPVEATRAGNRLAARAVGQLGARPT